MNVPAYTWPAHRFVVTGALSLAFLVFGFGIWLTTANLSGAIIVQGRLDQNRQSLKIQHLRGGVVSQVFVAEGQAVQANDILVKLTDTIAISELVILNARIFEISARRARLIAERDGTAAVAFPTKLVAAAKTRVTFQATLDGQVRLFAARNASLAQETAATADKSSQIAIQIEGIDAQTDALNSQLGLILGQLKNQGQLMDKGLTTAGALLTLNREAAIIRGKIGEATARGAGAAAQISTVRIGLLQATSRRREDTISQLRDLDFRLGELTEQRKLLISGIRKLDILAPADGFVLDLVSIGPNSVVKPAQVLMQIVPMSLPDRIVARVAPNQVDKLYLQQPVGIRFSTADDGRTPRLLGKVATISAGTLTDPRTGAPYFRIEIVYSAGEFARLGHAPEIFPDMPVDVFIKTTNQRAWVYLAKPFLGYFSRAMRES